MSELPLEGYPEGSRRVWGLTFTEYKIYIIVCLEPGRGIDRHAYRDTVAAAYSLQILRPSLGR